MGAVSFWEGNCEILSVFAQFLRKPWQPVIRITGFRKSYIIPSDAEVLRVPQVWKRFLAANPIAGVAKTTPEKLTAGSPENTHRKEKEKHRPKTNQFLASICFVFKGCKLYVPFKDQALRAENDDNPDNVFFCGLGVCVCVCANFSLHQQFLSP